jgi:hypothetical protein
MPQPGAGDSPKVGVHLGKPGSLVPGRGMLDPTSGKILRLLNEGGHTANEVR